MLPFLYLGTSPLELDEDSCSIWEALCLSQGMADEVLAAWQRHPVLLVFSMTQPNSGEGSGQASESPSSGSNSGSANVGAASVPADSSTRGGCSSAAAVVSGPSNVPQSSSPSSSSAPPSSQPQTNTSNLVPHHTNRPWRSQNNQDEREAAGSRTDLEETSKPPTRAESEMLDEEYEGWERDGDGHFSDDDEGYDGMMEYGLYERERYERETRRHRDRPSEDDEDE